jgi:hypothetical protein
MLLGLERSTSSHRHEINPLAKLCQQLEGTTKKLGKRALISGFLQKLQPKALARLQSRQS